MGQKIKNLVLAEPYIRYRIGTLFNIFAINKIILQNSLKLFFIAVLLVKVFFPINNNCGELRRETFFYKLV